MITDRLRESFRISASHNAFYFGERFFTYSDLEKKTLSVVGQISQNVRKTNPRVAVVTNNDLETYASVYATWLCGGAFIPLNPAFPAERNKKIIALSKAEIILNSKCNGVFNDEINTGLNCEVLESFPQSIPPPKDLMYILFTSGSTGEPKGVPITYENVSAFIRSFMSDGYFFSPADRFLQPFELSFDASLDCYLIPVLYGACIFPVPSEGLRYLQSIKIMQEQKITVAKLTPSMVALLKPYYSKINIPSLRYCLFGGEGLPELLVNEWQKCIPSAHIHNMYGPTEATVECFFYDATPSLNPRSHKGFISIGKPSGDTVAIITDELLNILPAGEYGELCLAGSQVTKGYLNNKTLNKTAFFYKTVSKKKRRFYRTGDIAMCDSDGFFFCTGRNDRQVKIQGYRVELDEIEICASEFSGMFRYAAILRDNTVLLFSDIKDKSGLMEWLEQKLPVWMVPAAIISLSEIPVNINGKTDYMKLQNHGG